MRKDKCLKIFLYITLAIQKYFSKGSFNQTKLIRTGNILFLGNYYFIASNLCPEMFILLFLKLWKTKIK